MNSILNKVLIFFIGVTACAAFISPPAQADGMDYQNYGIVGLGVDIPTGGLDDDGFDAGFATGVSYGRMLNRNLAIEGTFSYFFADRDSSGTTFVAGYYTREDDLSVSSILVTLKGLFPTGPITWFAGGGVGGYYVSLHSEIETSALGDFDTDEDDTVLGAHAVFGATWDLNNRIFLGGQGMYRWTDDVKIDKISATVPIRVDGSLEGFTVTFTGGIRF